LANNLYWEWSLGIIKNNLQQDSPLQLTESNSTSAIAVGAAFFYRISKKKVWLPAHYLGLGLQHVNFNSSQESLRLLNLKLAYRYEVQNWLLGANISPFNEFDRNGAKDFEAVQLELQVSRVLRLTQFFHVSFGPSLNWFLPDLNDFTRPNVSFDLKFRFIPHSSAASQSGFKKYPVFR